MERYIFVVDSLNAFKSKPNSDIFVTSFFYFEIILHVFWYSISYEIFQLMFAPQLLASVLGFLG